jgi:hypothetical protein
VAWWAWLALVWLLLAVAGGLVVGRAIRIADRHEVCPDRQERSGEEDVA